MRVGSQFSLIRVSLGLIKSLLNTKRQSRMGSPAAEGHEISQKQAIIRFVEVGMSDWSAE